MRALLLVALVSLGCGPERIRVVLVTLDTLRLDSLVATSGGEPTLPRLARLAEGAAHFERFYAATSITQPTHATLFTGLHPWEHGVTRNGMLLGEERVTVAERMRDAGFATAAVVAAFSMHRRFGWSQGFDLFRDDLDVALGGGRAYSLAAAVTERAPAALDALAQEERQLLWVHYYDPHDPYGDSVELRGGVATAELRELARTGDPTAAARVRQARALYDRDVTFLDEQLGRLTERLVAETDRWETHLIITSDHGESFGEVGAIGHGMRLSPEQLQVPLVIHSPRVAAGRRDDVAGSIDLFPTLLACAGLRHEGSGGRDLTTSLSSGALGALGMRRTYLRPRREASLTGAGMLLDGNRYYAVLDGRLYAGDAHHVSPDDRPGAAAEPALAERLRPRFAAFEVALRSALAREAVDAETRRRLRALGYAP